MRHKKPKPDFEIRLRGRYPEDVSVSAFAEAIGAIRRLVFRSEAEESEDVSGKEITLLDIARGSSIYRCVSPQRVFVLNELQRIGSMLGISGEARDLVATGLPQIRTLSDIAKREGTTIEVRHRTEGGKLEKLVEFSSGTYTSLRDKYTVSGATEISGELQRVGGSTRATCMLRLPEKNRALYCPVPQRLAAQMAQHLYQKITVSGEATWLNPTREVLEFCVKSFRPYEGGRFSRARELLRRAGADRWDHLPDSYAVLSSCEGAM